MARLQESLSYHRAEPNGQLCSLVTEELMQRVQPLMEGLQGPQAGGAGSSRPLTLPSDTIFMVVETSQPPPSHIQQPEICGGLCIVPRLPGHPTSRGLPEGEKVGEVKRNIVREPYRRKGIGTKMLAATEQEATTEGYTYLVVETLQQMSNAQEFYQRNGYRPRAVFGGYSENDSVFYKKSLR